GHLPHKGGDRSTTQLSPISNVVEGSGGRKLPISPLVGEMSGRTEGGNVKCQPPSMALIPTTPLCPAARSPARVQAASPCNRQCPCPGTSPRAAASARSS